jgi:Ca2+-transporting ATPase
MKNPKEDYQVKTLLKIGILCNDSRLEYSNESWKVFGDPTEGALLVAGAKAGMWKEKMKIEHPTVAEFPFSSDRKRMTTVHQSGDGTFAYMKGAPETVFGLCTHLLSDGQIRPITQDVHERTINMIHKMASEGLRVIGFAFKNAERIDASPEDIENGMTFVGLAGMIDPPREEVRDSIKLCREAGIKVVMITGDHKLTAMSVARELDIIEDESEAILTGADLDQLSPEKFCKVVENVKVYARVSPEHKVKILDALKRNGHIVAMTGDGVNDAPAMKNAHIGVAMGMKGTDVAKEASDMVLLDDNFSTIVKSVEEGRGIYDNIKKTIRFLLAANFGEILSVMLAIMMRLPLPILPLQILWINLVTDSLPALALIKDRKESDLMKRKPRDPKEHILSNMMVYIMATGALLCLVIIATLILELMSGASLDKARTVTMTSAIMFELFFAFNCRSERKSLIEFNPFSNIYLILAILVAVLLQLAIVYVPALQVMFGTVPLNLVDWGEIMLLGSLALIVSPKIFMKVK